MSASMATLGRLTYPGRLIIVGREASGTFNVVIYAVTGRSPSSQARQLVLEKNAIWTKPTDPDVLKKGNPELLVYPALILGRGFAVSNGRQTADIDAGSSRNPVEVLSLALQNWSYEPDAPIFTPRISGCILASNRAALNVIRRAEDGSSLRSFFELPLASGKGQMISTYAGENTDPLPSFRGEPLDLELTETSAPAMAEAAYAALAPREGEKDFRVAVACVFGRASDMTERHLHIINRHERTTT
jgi:IMP cyclohydrolase